MVQLFGKTEQLQRYVSRRQQFPGDSKEKQQTAGIKKLLQIKKNSLYELSLLRSIDSIFKLY